MSHLAQVTRGIIKKPICLYVYGVDGVGKSTLASQAPSPVFVGPENGTDQLDVARFKAAKTWTMLMEQIKELGAPNHDFKTLVIDTMDWLEPLLWSEICRRYNCKTIELAGGGYGKGYIEALKEWGVLKDELNNLRDNRGMNIVLLGHSEAIDFMDPTLQSNYMRYQMKLHKRAAAMWREWVDAVLFATFETFMSKDPNSAREKAFSQGVRVLQTERRAGWDAKNRYGLPLKLEMSWQAIMEGIEQGRPESPEAVRSRIEGMITAITSDQLKEKVIETLSKAGDNVRDLLMIEQRLSIRLNEQEQQPA